MPDSQKKMPHRVKFDAAAIDSRPKSAHYQIFLDQPLQITRPAGPVRPIKPLGHDAFKPHPARGLEDRDAVVLDMLVER